MDDLGEIQALIRPEEKCNHVSFLMRNLYSLSGLFNRILIAWNFQIHQIYILVISHVQDVAIMLSSGWEIPYFVLCDNFDN